jgi:hypothetical protein
MICMIKITYQLYNKLLEYCIYKKKEKNDEIQSNITASCLEERSQPGVFHTSRNIVYTLGNLIR